MIKYIIIEERERGGRREGGKERGRGDRQYNVILLRKFYNAKSKKLN